MDYFAAKIIHFWTINEKHEKVEESTPLGNRRLLLLRHDFFSSCSHG
jgi:hypothetical protein